MCECGDSEAMHIDGQEQCFVVDCGCKEFTEKEPVMNEAAAETQAERDLEEREILEEQQD